jgi:hydroxyacylglutathione hydrolase
MFFHQRLVPGLAAYTYLVGDEKTHRCAVIDPTRDIEDLIDVATKKGLRITDILETHVHADFVSGAVELKARLGGEPVIHCSGLGGREWTPLYADRVVSNGDEIDLGSIRLQALHTPGHTPEHVSWQLFDDSRSKETPWLVFTGDFVFIGDVGRPDLLGKEQLHGLARQLYTSVFQTAAGLPDYTEIYPSHGAGSLCGKAIGSRGSSTWGFERHFSPAFQQRPEREWIEERLAGMPESPPYFARMKKINREGPKVLGKTLPGHEALDPRDVADTGKNALVVDLRTEEEFAREHVPGSMNLPLHPNLSTWAGWSLPPDVPLVLLPPASEDVPAIAAHLVRVGFDSIRGHLAGGLAAWKKEGLPTTSLTILSPTELARRLEEPGDTVELVDVRTEAEWQRGHLEGARNVPLHRIAAAASTLPRDKTIAVVCGTGYRSSIAASLLQRDGIEDVLHLRGGMAAWGATPAACSARTPS